SSPPPMAIDRAFSQLSALSHSRRRGPPLAGFAFRGGEPRSPPPRDSPPRRGRRSHRRRSPPVDETVRPALRLDLYRLSFPPGRERHATHVGNTAGDGLRLGTSGGGERGSGDAALAGQRDGDEPGRRSPQ